jgi:flagellar biogenesis protein FliO
MLYAGAVSRRLTVKGRAMDGRIKSGRRTIAALAVAAALLGGTALRAAEPMLADAIPAATGPAPAGLLSSSDITNILTPTANPAPAPAPAATPTPSPAPASTVAASDAAAGKTIDASPANPALATTPSGMGADGNSVSPAPAAPPIAADSTPMKATATEIPIDASTATHSVETDSIRAGSDVGTSASLSLNKDSVAAPSSYQRFAPMGETAAALAVVIGLAFVARAGLKKFAPHSVVSSGKGAMEILARQPLSKNQTLTLIRVGSQLVLISQGKETSNSLLVVHEPVEVARLIGQIEGNKPGSLSASFANLLNGAHDDLQQPESEEVISANRMMEAESLDSQLDEMAAAKRQLMDLRQQVRSMRDAIPVGK